MAERHEIHALSENALRQLKNVKTIIREEVFNILKSRRDLGPTTGRHVRKGKTVSYKDPYPTSGNTFEVWLGEPDFDDKFSGDTDLDFIGYEPQENWVVVCRTTSGSYIAEDEIVDVVREHGKWYILDTGVSCDFIRFKSLTKTPLTDENCQNMKYIEAEVTAYPCGCGSVPGIDEYGKIRIYDTVGCHLFDEIDYQGKSGHAKYMIPVTEECTNPSDSYYIEGCKWEIVKICCGDVMTPVGINLKYSDADEYNEDEYCIEMERVLIPVCPVPTTPSELCGDGPCPEADCPDGYGDY